MKADNHITPHDSHNFSIYTNILDRDVSHQVRFLRHIKMFKLFIAAVVFAVVAADYESRWGVFKDTYKKRYSAPENAIRKSIWIANHQLIEEHNELYNKGLSTFYLGENEFADMTNTEFVAMMNGLRLNVTGEPAKYFIPTNGLPDSVDWRKKGYVTPIKNQGLCGSCWAFSAVGSMEGQHFKATGDLVSLSESNLVDCSTSFGNQGCNGGLMDLAFKYVISNHGIDTEASYPYMAEECRCYFKANSIGATISAYTDVASQSESALQQATAQIGPISVVIDAGHASFQLYRDGIYYEPACSSTRLDHGVLVIGYGSDSGKDYWLVKNSWGTSWGMEGFIKMSRNRNNNCGIATQASFPRV